jgi:hypothetical protein
VNVEPAFRDQLEGTEIKVVDGRGTVLLEGKIVLGSISREIEKIKDIDLTKLFVQPKKR